MSGVSFPVNRPMGRALVVGAASTRAGPIETLQRMYSFECAEADDPYSGMLELCRRKVVYNALILSLAGLYREELAIIATVKRRFPHLEIWLTHTDGRHAALVQAVRLGADGLLGEDGLHRLAPIAAAPEAQSLVPPADDAATEQRTAAGAHLDAPPVTDVPAPDEPPVEPVLTAEELRALLHEQPSMPPANNPPEG